MRQLSLKSTLRLHRELWNRLADGIAQTKSAVSKEKVLRDMGYNPLSVDGLCFCCEYTKQRSQTGRRDCSKCPLRWPDGKCITDNDAGLYDRWYSAVACCNFEKAEEYARTIADLPKK